MASQERETQYTVLFEAGRLPKNSQDHLRVIAEETNNGVALLDCRVWKGKAEDDEAVATGKGLCLRPEVWRKVIGLLEGALERLESKDFFDGGRL